MSAAAVIDAEHREFVGSLAKGLSVIRALGGDKPEMTVADVAKATDMTRAGARRLLLTLHALGYVQSDSKYYALAPKVLELGFAYISSRSWLSMTTPILEKLRTDLFESVSVVVLEGQEVVYVARFPADRVMTMSIEIGSRRPAFCTAMGRVLLGELSDDCIRQTLQHSAIQAFTDNTVTNVEQLMGEIKTARQQGYALIDSELEHGLVAVSVPLRNSRGTTLAAVNVCGHSSHLTVEDLEKRCLPALHAAVSRISMALV